MKLADKVENIFLRKMSFSRSEIHFSRFYLKNYECDIYRISKTDMVYEYEIKVSASDFKADFEKHNKTRRNGKITIEYKHDDIDKGLRTNYFSFVVDSKLKHLAKTTNEKYGFYSVDVSKGVVECIRRPKKLHNKKFNDWKRLCRKIFYRGN